MPHNPKSGQEVAKQTSTGADRKPKRSLSRSHQDYWKSRLERRCYTRDGEFAEVNEWSVRVQHLGKRKSFALNTTNKDVAASKARDIYLTVVAKGWEAAERQFAPEMILSDKIATVGEFLDQVRATSPLKPVTFAIYARKFRTLVAGVFNIRGGKEKFDYVNGGRANWLARVNKVRLDKLTGKRIEKWKVGYLQAAAAKDPLAHKRAKTTINSLVRAGKSLFTSEVLKPITLRVPSPSPFAEVTNVKLPRNRYKSEINPHALFVAAKRELADGIANEKLPANPQPEMFKIFLLALGAGLRRREIDSLTWKQIDWHRSTIRVETTSLAGTKSDRSEDDVRVDPELLKMLRVYMSGSQSPFVINSNVKPRPLAVTYAHYRCDSHFNALIKWLRQKGITSTNALHALRKEYGSLICQQSGIYAASTALRHSSIQLTVSHYIDQKQKVALDMGQLLNPPQQQAAALGA